MYEGAQRAAINNTAKHSRNDASGTRKHHIDDCQYRRKCLCHRCFRYVRIQRMLLDRHCGDSSKVAESVRHGL
jgi:hypothetical protein